jgi:hypothetical protein
MQILSNDIYKAANHRVLAPKGGQGRYSVPVFFNPRVDAILEPLPDFVTPERPAGCRPVPWKEFLGLRVAGVLPNPHLFLSLCTNVRSLG